MANNITNVKVSVAVPVGHVIEIKDAIEHGSGTLGLILDGGQVAYELKLTSGTQLLKLKKGEAVHVHGTMDGKAMVIPIALTTGHPEKPWTFSGESGETGP